jgi:hypothetical protein
MSPSPEPLSAGPDLLPTATFHNLKRALSLSRSTENRPSGAALAKPIPYCLWKKLQALMLSTTSED